MAKTTKGIVVRSFAANAVGEGDVLLSFRIAVGERHFAMPAEDVPLLISQLVAAASKAAQTNERLPPAVRVMATTVATDRQSTVTLSMMPTPELHIPFSMPADLARKTMESLSKALDSLPPG